MTEIPRLNGVIRALEQGHPHVDAVNVERVLKEGYRFLMAAPTRGYAALEKGKQLAGRN